ncbi:MAG: HAD family phosphatase, partial [Candidatus Pacebacteria bacterium]|nr:HAD family phosphatase [Candidatus Paceibacterota bacterium]
MINTVIFDMDGVISDTQKLHAKVESQMLAKFGIFLSPEEITMRYAGVRTREFLSDLLDKQGASYDIEALLKEKWAAMEKAAQEEVEEVPGSIALITDLHQRGIPIAVASASNLEYVRTVLQKLGVFESFQAIVTGDMVQKGKPDPESFLLAAEKLGVLPHECLVIEDGISGMEAAHRASMQCIG